MPKFDVSEFQKQRPLIQMAPLIDIIFLTLVFFMTVSVFNQMESELNISVPKSKESKEATRSPGEIIINVTEDGQYLVNQKQLNLDELSGMLKQVSQLFPNQPVIIRADQKTFHRYVVEVLDACAKAEIWDISFATTTEGS